MEKHNRSNIQPSDSLTRQSLAPSLPHNQQFLSDWDRADSDYRLPVPCETEVEFLLRGRVDRYKRRQSNVRALRFAGLTAIGLLIVAALFLL